MDVIGVVDFHSLQSKLLCSSRGMTSASGNTVVPAMSGHLGTEQKYPYIAGGRSIKGRTF